MSDTSNILTAEQMKQWYGNFYGQSPKLNLDPRNVPEQFWPLLPYAEFWGIADDWTREASCQTRSCRGTAELEASGRRIR